MPPRTDPLHERFARELRALDVHPPVVLELTAVHAWALLCQLQLALRHPANTGPTSQLGRQMARRLQEAVARPGSALAEVAERAWQGE